MPKAAQRALRLPERAAPAAARRDPGAAPGGADHVRRLLRPRRADGPEPGALRVPRRRRPGVLRRRRRQVQLRARRAVRHEGRHRVPGPVDARVVGRCPLHGGGEPADRRGVAQGTLLPSSCCAALERRGTASKCQSVLR